MIVNHVREMSFGNQDINKYVYAPLENHRVSQMELIYYICGDIRLEPTQVLNDLHTETFLPVLKVSTSILSSRGRKVDYHTVFPYSQWFELHAFFFTVYPHILILLIIHASLFDFFILYKSLYYTINNCFVI